MKLATLKDGSRDGQLAVVARDLQTIAIADAIAPTLQRVLDDWLFYAPQLQDLSDALNHGQVRRAFAFEPANCMAPLPRAFQRIDAAAYPSYTDLVSRTHHAGVPMESDAVPLMYRSSSDDFLAPNDDIVCESESYGIDFAAGLAALIDDVPLGVGADAALDAIRLLTLVNDVSLRHLSPVEPAHGLAWLQGQPSSACAPLAVTPDEFGEAWQGGRLQGRLSVHWNRRQVGALDCGAEMACHFGQLIAHAARTRRLRAGTIIGSGTVSNSDRTRGYGCIAEKRMIETIDTGAPVTEFMHFGERVRIEMFDGRQQSIFGAIEQRVAAPGALADAFPIDATETSL